MKIRLLLLIAPLIILSCKGEDKFTEPNYVLRRWERAIEKQDYKEYCRCEAYPKREAVFKEMYKDYFIADSMANSFREEEDIGEIMEMCSLSSLGFSS